MADSDREKTPAGTAPDVFISYASADSAVAAAVCSALERAGVKCWIAPRDVVPGEFYAGAIVHALDAAKLVVLVLSQSAAASAHVLREVERASSKRHPVVSFRIDLGALPAELEYFLNTSHWLDASNAGIDQALPKLTDAVQRLVAPASAGKPGDAGSTAKPGADTAPTRPAGKPASQRLSLPVIAVGALLVLALAYLVVDKFMLSPRNQAPPATPPAVAPTSARRAVSPALSEKSVAVLPFVDMSEKKDQEYFSDGLTEELIDLLAKIPDLRVPARTSSFSFRGRAVTVGEIGQALNVAHVLEGSVRKSGHTVRITAQLIRVDNGYHLWSETYDRDVKDVFKVQDDIARVVVEKLKLTLLTTAPSAPVRTANSEVHNLYLQGRFFTQSDTAAGLEKAIGFLQHAIALDPAYGPAWAELGYAQFRQVANGYIPVRQGLETVSAAAAKATALDPALADPYILVGMVKISGSHDWAGARVAIDKALQADPTNVRALFFDAHLRRIVGSADDALVHFMQTLERDPLNLLNRRYVARVLYHAGRLDEAEAMVRQVLNADPSFTAAHYELGRILLARGQVAAAVAEFEAEANPGWRAFGLPLGYHAQGRAAEANAALAVLVSKPAGQEYQIAETYAYFGNADQAFVWLDRSIDHDPGIQWLRGDPLLRSITADPRYTALLHTLNLPR